MSEAFVWAAAFAVVVPVTLWFLNPPVSTLVYSWRLRIDTQEAGWRASDGFVNHLDIVLNAPYDEAPYTEAMWKRFGWYIDNDQSGRLKRIVDRLEELRQLKLESMAREAS